jgi:hypothetical protein
MVKKYKAVGKTTDNTYMDNKDRRKYPRVAIFDPISFTCTDSKDNVLEEDIGVALNACQNGIQIESFRKIDSELEMKNIEIKGKVIYSRKTESGVFKTGIRLLASHEKNVEFVKNLVKFYHYCKVKQKSSLHISEATSR